MLSGYAAAWRRKPGWSFSTAVITASALVIVGGMAWMMRWVPRSF